MRVDDDAPRTPIGGIRPRRCVGPEQPGMACFSSRSAATELCDENTFHPRQFCLAISSTLTAVYAEVRYDMRIGRARQRWYRSEV
jgi:hypothetical protein